MKHIFCILIFSIATQLQGQIIKKGQIKKEHFNLNLNENQQNASAVILSKNRETSFFFEDEDAGWQLSTTIHQVIKIQNKEGLDYGNVTVKLYRKGQDEERIDDVEATSYYLEGKKIEKTKLSKKQIFENEISENWTEVSLTIPGVRVGSIIEFSYEVQSPFWKIDDLEFQDEIPVRYYSAQIRVPQFFEFNRYIKGFIPVEPEEEYKSKSLNFSYNQRNSYGTKTGQTKFANMKYQQLVSDYELTNIPPLKKESYVNNINNFKGTVVYELASYEFTAGEKKYFATSWEKVSERISKSDRFGRALAKNKFPKEMAIRFRESTQSKEDLINAVYEHIKSTVKWNGKYGVFVDKSLKKALSTGSGNVAEVNLNLVSLLRDTGLNAHPILVSTKNHGVPLYPTIEGFNYVIAGVQINEQWMLLDATSIHAPPGILPERTLNWEGIMIKENGSTKKINLFPKSHSTRDVIVTATISPEGVISGNYKERLRGNISLAERNQTMAATSTAIAAKKAEAYALQEVVNLNIEKDNLRKPLETEFDFESENLVDIIGDKMYLSPLLFLKLDTNPFESEERLYPVDFVYPVKFGNNITIELPEGYTLETKPEPLNIMLAPNVLNYTFNVQEVNGVLNVVSNVTINRAIVSYDFYKDLRAIYSRRLQVENDKIVLIKK